MTPEQRASAELNYQKWKMLDSEGAAVVLEPGGGDAGTVYVTAATIPAPPDLSFEQRPRPWHLNAPRVLPQVVVAAEHYNRLIRLLGRGIPVQLEINIAARFYDDDPMSYNLIAEIPGTDLKDEVVMIGGCLDSWHTGTGATDNGTGSMAVLAAARALVKSGVKPKRTIRFVLFTGEEQGLNGSKAYVAAHKDEMSKISGVLVHDTGTGKVLTIGLMHNYAARETIDRVLYPLAKEKSIALAEPSLRSEGGSDHVPFDQAGVPASWCVQEVANYEKDHHSQNDTLDRVQWDDLAEGAQVLAVYAYNVAQLPEMLPRKPATPRQPEAH